MTKAEILEKITQYLEEYFEVPAEDITPDAHLYEDLDLDSIDAVDLIVKLQEITGQKIAPENFREVRTVSHVVDKVAELLEDK